MIILISNNLIFEELYAPKFGKLDEMDHVFERQILPKFPNKLDAPNRPVSMKEWKVPFQGVMSIREKANAFVGPGGAKEISIFFPQFCCNSNTAVKK